MKSHQASDDGRCCPNLRKVAFLNCRHFMITGTACRMEGPLSQAKSTSVIFSAAHSVISFKFAFLEENLSFSTWWQFLRIYEDVSNIFIVRIISNVTSLKSLALEPEMCSSFSFLRRSISTTESIPLKLVPRLRVLICKQEGRINLINSKEKI